MTDHESGRIVSVESIPLGSDLNGDHLAGVTELTVNDAVDFDWDGGSLVIDGQVIAYTTFNDDTGVITLSEALAADADDGTRVDVYDTYYGRASVEKVALVNLDGDSYNTDTVTCTVANHLVDKLAEGLRDTNGESVLIEIDSAEWRIIDVLGLGDPEATGTQFYQDLHTVTATGDQTVTLTHEPITNSEHLYWNGLYQPASEWSRSGQTVTVPDASSVIAVGDELVMEYAYLVSGSPTQNPTLVAEIVSRNTAATTLHLYLDESDGTANEVSIVDGDTTAFYGPTLGDVTMRLTDTALGTTATYPDAAHFSRVAISGTDSRGAYTGHRYSIEDWGGDADFNDIVVDVKGY